MHWVGGDTHLYTNHIKQAQEMLTRSPLPLSRLDLGVKQSIDDYVYEDFHILDYQHHPAINGAISI